MQCVQVNTRTLEWVELVAERRAFGAGREAFGCAIDADDTFRWPQRLAPVRMIQLNRRHNAAVHYCEHACRMGVLSRKE